MAKTWTDQETSYLKRYAKTKTLAALAERFEAGDDEVRERLAALGLVTKDGEPSRGASAVAADPEIGDFQAGLRAVQEHDWETARARLEQVIAKSDRPELVARARQHLAIAERHAAPAPKKRTGGDPYLEAVYAKNRGDLDAALSLVDGARGDDADGHFAYLAASLHSLGGREQEAAEALTQAVARDPAHRVRAFHDPDLAELRKRKEHAHLFGLD